MPLVRIALAVMLFFSAIPAALSAAPRVALVMGNSAYETAPLINPKNDADLMARTLESIGFEVVHATDLTQRGMKAAIVDFGERLEQAGPEAVGLVFFAGHGVQSNGQNYLIPVDAKLEKESYLDIEAVPANWVLGQMEAARNALNFMILDACRNNPFTRSFRSGTRGLARMDAPRGTLIAYATKPGDVAADGLGRNSPYTKALSIVMRRPGLSASHMFIEARNRVLEETNDQQTPWEEGGLTAPFYFAGKGNVAAQTNQIAPPVLPQKPPGPSRADAETMFWNSVTANPTVGAYEAYLKTFPTGRYVPLAEVRLDELTRGSEPPVEDEQVAIGTYDSFGPPDDQPGTRFKDCAECPEMVVLPRGDYKMGSPSYEPERSENEGPLHVVNMHHGVAAGVFEVTRDEFAAFVTATGYNTGDSCTTYEQGAWKERSPRNWRNPGFRQTGRDPAVCISFRDAQAYVEWLSLHTNAPYGLLSEAEWEYAARGGTTTAFSTGPRLEPNQARFDARHRYNGSTLGDFRTGTVPVGSYQPNGYGLYDVHGNALEWTDDCWNDSYEGAPTDGLRWTEGDCQQTLVRGGSWYQSPAKLRSAMRFVENPEKRLSNAGLRVGRDVPLQ